MKIYLVRHGQTDWNYQKKIQGQQDVDINEQGIRQAEKLANTKRLVGDIKEIWSLQPRFEQRSGKRPYALLGHARFRAGYDFMLLRAETGEIDASIADWWTAFSEGDHNAQETLIASAPREASPAKKRRRSGQRSRRTGDASGSESGHGHSASPNHASSTE